MTGPPLNVAVLIVLAILAFAGNSILTRLALTQSLIGATDFTAIRLLSGACVLVVLCRKSMWNAWPRWRDATGVAALFVYAIAFTVAYLEMNTATGALVLFATVQLTMIVASRLKGQRLTWRETAGVILAFGGLAWLLAPGAAAPPLQAAALMALAGAAWGVYTLDGRSAASPLHKTARNFVGAAVLGLIPMLMTSGAPRNIEGMALAIASGAITSAIGYAIWYSVLPRMTVALAGTSQLAVPLVAAAGGAILIGEALTLRLLIASAVVLAGIAFTVFGRTPSPPLQSGQE